MRVLGVDPGMSGALALVEDDRLLWVHDMPVVPMTVAGRKKNRLSAGMLAELIDYDWQIDRAYVELVHAMPKQGVSSSFAFGESFGAVQGVLAALKIPYHLIRPQDWRKATGVRGDKDASRHRATELFPDKAKFFMRKKDDGRAEAALMAYAGQRT